MTTTKTLTMDACLAKLRERLTGGHRIILGVVGQPGSGKSTFSEALVAGLPGQAIAVPMDGFHLANSELDRLKRRDRKGAEDTFNSAGYVALLKRLRDQPSGEVVYAPEFRREFDEPIANAIAITPEIQCVITEGNYLLLDRGHWRQISGLLDATWYLDIPSEIRQERLIARHRQFGRDEQSARAWVSQTDEPNAVLIAATQGRADLIFNWSSSA
ncbi:nucleoside/nucleotide kinase family protein [Glaciimonas immobilis]|uniref:Pantothenate kinase n=1 Tax=Glaciimonas immobilis TaxID=728004 RepID=A0A840RL37_9BURK|nr:nucleoside/nucleotide kinase family protein [Glaciimonas immobilis]KAF3999463.1 nucleoside/nucleotide kinase family protein [Glaciimonas immobilis]MBB5198977.1 pantothenate kinase [Glaciimonas immobilis]